MKGHRLKTLTVVCTACNGVGQEQEQLDIGWYHYLEDDCPVCHGDGTIEIIKSKGYRLSEPGPRCIYREAVLV
ncbi:hypothetical protein D3C85_1692070 [compost metagenome]